MAIKDILVVVDETPQCEERMNVALRLAARHESHVMGLMVRDHVRVPRSAASRLPAAFLDEQRELEEAARGRVRERLEGKADAAGIRCEWHAADGDPVNAVALYSRHADLAVIGQEDPESGGYGTVKDLAEHVALASGRPVLVVPHVGTYPNVGRRVMIAWDASREAARAVGDALPLLRAAEQVVTFSANPDSGREKHGGLPGADISRHLARHGVRVDAQRVNAREVAIADLILNRISDEGIDLLVMGAYGHARMREIWLGGVTRRLMQHMTVPVFISH